MFEKDNTLRKLQAWKEESKEIRAQKNNRVAKNLKLFKGIFRTGENPTSKIRGKNKTFYRKIWATIWRLTATMYQAFMKDQETFSIKGRDYDDDPRKAKVLQKIVEYHKDVLYSTSNLFIKMIWAIHAVLVNGWVCGKVTREYDEERGIDRVKVMIYPFEQVFPDWSAETDDEMRYIGFLNYMTADDLRVMGLEPPVTPPSSPESSEIRDVRYQSDTDPQMNAGPSGDPYTASGGHYPEPGSTPDTEIEESFTKKYNIYESFWRENGVVMYAISNEFDEWLLKPKESKYGDRFPIFTGQCLTEMHKLAGEGLPEPLEAPQESYNYNLNMRKDGLALSMSGHTYVSRYGGVDLGSISNKQMNKITIMDDINAVKHEQMPDVTGNAYTEAYADEEMMDDMSGVNKTISGQQDPSIKATTAQLNQTNSSAKIDLYVGIMGETLFKGLWSEISRQVILFETDEKIFRIANEKLRIEEDSPYGEEIYDLDIDIDCKVIVNPSAIGQGLYTQQILMAMDRGIMAIQAVPALAQMGMIPPEGLNIPNITSLYVELLKNIGMKDYKKHIITLPPPQQPMEGGAGSPPGPLGTAGMETNNEAVQRGSGGGI